MVLSNIKYPPTGAPVPNPTPCFWIDSQGANILAKEGSQGSLTTDADVCIIGSGITGVSAAYHLAHLFNDNEEYREKKIKVAILEARDFCSGATGRNGGHLTPFLFRGFANRSAFCGSEEAKKIYDLEAYTVEELKKIIEVNELDSLIDFVSTRNVWVLRTEEEEEGAKRNYEAAKSAGIDVSDVEWKSKEEMLSTYGIPFPANTIPGYNLWPLKLVTYLYFLARFLNPKRLSIRLHTNTLVTAISPLISQSPLDTASPHRRWSLSTPRGTMHCSYIIHATNAYASYLLPHLHGPTGIVPTRGQAMALRAAVPLSELTTSSWCVSCKNGCEYWFPRPVNDEEESPLVVLGGGREASGPEFELYETDDSVVNPAVSEELIKFLPQMIPRMFKEGQEPEMEWTGIMGYTSVNTPFVGPVVVQGVEASNYKGQYISAGYDGHGMPLAYACAEIVSGMIAADMTGISWKKPEWFPRHYLTTERRGVK